MLQNIKRLTEAFSRLASSSVISYEMRHILLVLGERGRVKREERSSVWTLVQGQGKEQLYLVEEG